MDDWFAPTDDAWEAGFVADRAVVVSRLGPINRVFERPPGFSRRFYQRVLDLPVNCWRIEPEPLSFGDFCSVRAELTIHYQLTLRYVRDHLDFVDELDEHIRRRHLPIVSDEIDSGLRGLEADCDWLEQGVGGVERAIERRVNEALTLSYLNCRSTCRIEATFQPITEPNLGYTQPWSRHRRLYLELLQRRQQADAAQREALRAQLMRERQERMAQEAALLELAVKEAALSEARFEQELAQQRREIASEEDRLAIQRESELRQCEDQVRHTETLRAMERESEVQDKNRRAANVDEVESHLRREIELLAMERQRLLLEQEVRDTRLAKARGWVINAKKRFPLGNKNAGMPPENLPEESE